MTCCIDLEFYFFYVGITCSQIILRITFRVNLNLTILYLLYLSCLDKQNYSRLKVLPEAVAQSCSVKKSSYKFRKIHRKRFVLESFFKKITGLRPATLLKRDFRSGILWIICKQLLLFCR